MRREARPCPLMVRVVPALAILGCAGGKAPTPAPTAPPKPVGPAVPTVMDEMKCTDDGLVVADGDHVYWIADEGLVRVPRAKGERRLVVALEPWVAEDLELDGGALFYTAGTRIMTVNPQGGSPQELAIAEKARWLAVDDEFIYW